MADQFCRIVDATICDATLGADATEAVITTDSTTSFVIREIYGSQTCAENSNLSFSPSLVMDGHTVVSDTDGVSSGSMIVPPSTTVCFVDSSGNFPLTYSCAVLFHTICCACSIAKPISKGICAVNNVSSGPGCVVCECNCNYVAPGTSVGCAGVISIEADCSKAIIFCDDNNSVTGLTIRCIPTSTNVFEQSSSYCKWAFNDGIAVKLCGGLGPVLEYGIGCTTSVKCVCISCGLAPTTYPRLAISSPHPDCFGCRAYFSHPGGSCTNLYQVGAFNVCSVASGLIPHQLLASRTFNSFSDTVPCVCKGTPDAGSWSFIYWSSVCSDWVIGWGYPNYIVLAPSNQTGTVALRSVYINCLFTPHTTDNYWFENNGRIYNGLNQTCYVVSVGLDDLLVNGIEAEVTCHFDYVATSGQTCYCLNGGVPQTVKPQTATVSSPTPADYDINPSYKFTAYGIKSTTQG